MHEKSINKKNQRNKNEDPVSWLELTEIFPVVVDLYIDTAISVLNPMSKRYLSAITEEKRTFDCNEQRPSVQKNEERMQISRNAMKRIRLQPPNQ